MSSKPSSMVDSAAVDPPLKAPTLPASTSISSTAGATFSPAKIQGLRTSAAASSSSSSINLDGDDNDDKDSLLRRINSNRKDGKAAVPTCRRCRAFKQLGPKLAEFLTEIPKTDLHVHLDGSPRLSTLIELAQTHGVELPAYTEEGLRTLVFHDAYDSLVDYLRGFPPIVRVMQQPGALERIAYEFAWDCINEGVRYIEPRFAPQLLATVEVDVIGVLKAAVQGLERAENEFNARTSVQDGSEPPFRFGIICCAMRVFMTDVSEYYRAFCALHKDEPPTLVYQLAASALVHAAIHAKKHLHLPIVGIDIAGQEAGFPAEAFQTAFEVAHKNFLGATVHAGEAFGPEAVFQAITDLHCERLGHGYHLFSVDKVTKKENPAAFVEGLVQYVAKRRIMLEVCLTSNRQTMVELRDDISKHALKDMLAHGICVSLCTDNRLISNTTVVKELLLAIQHFALTPTELKTIILEGFKRSFFPGKYLEKRVYVSRMINYYEHIERKYGLHDWYLSEESVREDRHNPCQQQQKQRQQQQQGEEQQQPSAEGLGALVCDMHANGDRLQTYSPQCKGPTHFSQKEDGILKRDKHDHNQHLDMPPEVFI
ncbi:adenosine deaminase [Nannochloropsis oceanica]